MLTVGQSSVPVTDREDVSVTTGLVHGEAQGGRATVGGTFYHAGLVLPSGSSSSEPAFGQQQIETGQTLPPWSCQSALQGTALTLTGVKHVVLVEARSLSGTAAVLSG